MPEMDGGRNDVLIHGPTDLGAAALHGANLSWAKLKDARRTSPERTSIRRRTSGRRTSGGGPNARQVGRNASRKREFKWVSNLGISAWNIKINQETKQSNLIITPVGEATIEVDDIKSGCLSIYCCTTKIREVINSVTSKAVLILGRFAPERKVVLDAIRMRLREDYGLVSILFDWEPSASRDLTEKSCILC
jgi:hypothetical protein